MRDDTPLNAAAATRPPRSKCRKSSCSLCGPRKGLSQQTRTMTDTLRPHRRPRAAMAAHAVATEIKALLPEAMPHVEVGFRPGTEMGIDVECVRDIVRRHRSMPRCREATSSVRSTARVCWCVRGHVFARLQAKTSVALYADVPTGSVLQRLARKKPRERFCHSKDGHRSLGGVEDALLCFWPEGRLVYYEKENGIEKG